MSPATASRVLNNPNYHCFDPKMRERIWKVAMELQYVPNEAARKLKSGEKKEANKTYYIQVLMTRFDSGQMDPFFDELLHIIESGIHKKFCILTQVWHMSLFSDDRKCRQANLEKIVKELYDETEGKSNGVILVGKVSRVAIPVLKKYFKNIVAVNRNASGQEIDEITCDGKLIANEAVEYLISLGHQDIGYVGNCERESRYKDLAKVRQRYFSLSIISSDNIELAQQVKPLLTTVALPKEEMGYLAVMLLLDRIEGYHKTEVAIGLKGHLLVRDSCRKFGENDWSDYVI